MPTYVLHRGRLIEKHRRPVRCSTSGLPAPAVQSFDSYVSPASGEPVSSSRQRERDLCATGSYDPRDIPDSFRKAQHARRQFAKRTPGEPA